MVESDTAWGERPPRTRKRPGRWLGLVLLSLVSAGAVGYALRLREVAMAAYELLPHLHPRWDEAALRRRFMAEHPGQKPLNWAIGEAAMKLRRERPMGRFILGLTPGKYGNDCSDFVAAAVDDGLGARARFRRGSQQHAYGEAWWLFDTTEWRPGVVVMPGDTVSVRHSPWYAPNPDACWHIGVVGADGQVYDFTKLRSWRGPRYGRQPFERFVRHSLGEGEVILSRLRPVYRYRAQPLPESRVSAPGSEATVGR